MYCITPRDTPETSTFADKKNSRTENNYRWACAHAEFNHSSDEDVKELLQQAFITRINELSNEHKEETSMSQQILAACLEGCKFIRDNTKVDRAGVLFPDNELILIGSPEMDLKLTAMWYKMKRVVPPETPLREVLRTIEARSRFDEDVISAPIFSRVGYNKKTKRYQISLYNQLIIYFDNKGSYELIEQSHPEALYFAKSNIQAPFPIPSKENHNIHALWKHLNIDTAEDRLKILAWMLSALKCSTVYPILELIGLQGSTKSTTQRRIRSLIDPTMADSASKADSGETIALLTYSQHVISFENIVYLSKDIQATLCQSSTGGTYSKRKHYTNNQNQYIELLAPVILNSISSHITTSDLLERSIQIECQDMRGRKGFKSPEKCIEEWEDEYNLIFSGLIDLMAKVLQILPSVRTKAALRMVDYVTMGEALVKLFGRQEEGTFEGYMTLANSINLISLSQGSPAAAILLEYAKSKKNKVVFDGFADELWRELLKKAKNEKRFPTSSRGLMGALSTNMLGLREQGIEIDRGIPGRDKKRKLKITVNTEVFTEWEKEWTKNNTAER